MALPIEFVVRGVRSGTTEALRQFAIHRLSFALRRFAHRIRRVTVRFVDENGPRRGVDSRCLMAAELVDGGRLFVVEATTARPFAAITLAAARLATMLRRDAGRHGIRRMGPQALR
jgi:ribosome-associated translation inhibitor RaiA